MAYRGGRPRNHLLDDNFTDIIVEGKKCLQNRCNHCGHQTTKSTYRAQQHLDQCDIFLRHQKEVEKETENIVASKPKQLPITSMIRPLSQAQVNQLHRANAMAVYMTNIPFNHYENPYVIESYRLLHPSYKPPHRKLIAGKLLDETYEAIKLQVMERLNASQRLNFFTDETANIRKERVINLCCHVPSSKLSFGGGFHLKAVAGLAEKMDAATQAEWMIQGCLEATNHQLERVNCISTDSCATMRSMWSHIEKHPKMKHVFFVPCDSHGLQLLLGDILKFPFFSEVIRQSQLIVTSFRASNKEMAVLWEFQMKAYNQRRSLILNVLTRWGSLIGLLTSVLKNQQALLEYFQQKKPGIDQRKNFSLESIVNDYSFWSKLRLIIQVVEPIHQLQYTSEAEGYKLHTMAANWNKIRSHLYSMAKETEEEELYHIAKVIWEDRYLTQSTELHVVAALLIPENYNVKVVGVTTEHAFVNIMHRFFDRYVLEEERPSAMKSWLAFRNQEEEFHTTADCWKYKLDPDLFWQFCSSFASTLSLLARRVVMLPGNLVLAERSWSIMNLIMNKTRNSLGTVNVDKLMFIYMNDRTLHRPKEIQERLRFAGVHINEDHLCEMKDALLQEETALLVDEFSSSSASSKRPASQQITGDATRNWAEK